MESFDPSSHSFKRLCEVITAEGGNIKTSKYAGGNPNGRNGGPLWPDAPAYFNKHYGSKGYQPPPVEEKCACGCEIVEQAYIFIPETKLFVVVGNCCCRRWMHTVKHRVKCVECDIDITSNEPFLDRQGRTKQGRIYNFCDKHRKVCHFRSGGKGGKKCEQSITTEGFIACDRHQPEAFARRQIIQERMKRMEEESYIAEQKRMMEAEVKRLNDKVEREWRQKNHEAYMSARGIGDLLKVEHDELVEKKERNAKDYYFNAKDAPIKTEIYRMQCSRIWRDILKEMYPDGKYPCSVEFQFSAK